MGYKLVDYKNLSPNIHETVYLADGVVIAGDVTIQEYANIWFNSVIRGDVAKVTIGKNTNIQDGTVIHTSRFDGPTHIGSNITIGHMALIHACSIEDNAFIGMQSTVMDKSIVEEYGFLGAGSLLSPGKIVRKNEMWIGRPAKFVRMITDQEREFMQGNLQNYLDLAKAYKK
ncbi:Gamma carbonic anhydrase family protein [Candidatus Megaera venefica]|uniref:Gamma carbonic anhydrase family protein n=1 Tax=Candidatus Megaera venefica TaxID=2055910 RepID=A0ABU5NEI7_9RICK|nr:gamma carbonic anhydrase family protein [Candidatus Megaera venefica]MEA0971571.1 Gamma carbonic anhydrase family protein [Candidatus Megaera venefica]